jgi:hypothetical protein
MILFDTVAGEDHSLVCQEIYFDIFGFITPGTGFDTQRLCAVVRIA